MQGSSDSETSANVTPSSNTNSKTEQSVQRNEHSTCLNNGAEWIEKMAETYHERVAILDFGAQFGKVIDRRIREQNVLSEILPFNTKAADLIAKGYYKAYNYHGDHESRAIVLSGGPNSVYADNASQFDLTLLTCGLPVLGICYGFQLLNKAFGGGVSSGPIREDGQIEIDIDAESPLFSGLSSKQRVLLTHGDSVTGATVASNFKVIARSANFVAGIADNNRKLFGVQFHPEVDLSLNGKEMLHNFLYRIAKFSGNFTITNREQKCIEEIRAVVGNKKVLVMVSGGVDSTVCATLLRKALGAERIIAVHIDNGFMRSKESSTVTDTLNKLGLNVKRINAYYAFMNGRVPVGDKESSPLMRTVHPELKRKIIGDTFMRVKDSFLEEMKLGDVYLAQGTLRPDLIESASSLASENADVIKTHHNDTALVRELRELGKVVEPLKDFHKDEVRELGLSLGLPPHAIHRHPFPGPGLAIRIICAESTVVHDLDLFLNIQHQLNLFANLIHNEEEDVLECDELAALARSLSHTELKKLCKTQHGISITLLPIQTVGVQGDKRSYAYAAALSTDERPIPWELLEHLSQVIPRLVHYINRIVYVFGNSISYPINDVTRTYLNNHTISLVQWADRLATDVLRGLDEDGKPDSLLENCYLKVQQMPVVMLPVHFDRDPSDRKSSSLRSFVLRPFITGDFMTGLPALPGRDLPEKTVLEMARRITKNVPFTSRVMLDLTSKPPGTTEWE